MSGTTKVLYRMLDESRFASLSDRLLFENRWIEPFDDIRRCFKADRKLLNRAATENIVRLKLIEKQARQIADYDRFCCATLGITE